MKQQKTEKETQNLMELLSSLPAINKDNLAKVPDDKPKKKWTGSKSNIKNNGRVNRTKGK